MPRARMPFGETFMKYDEPIGFRQPDGLQEDGIDDGEDGRVRADAQRQRGNRRGGKRRVLTEHAEGVPEVLQESVHGCTGTLDATRRGQAPAGCKDFVNRST